MEEALGGGAGGDCRRGDRLPAIAEEEAEEESWRREDPLPPNGLGKHATVRVDGGFLNPKTYVYHFFKYQLFCFFLSPRKLMVFLSCYVKMFFVS